MDQKSAALNHFLVDVFNEILKTEELCISKAGFKNLSLRELHVIEAVCNAEDRKTDCRASAIAADLRVTAGTLTSAVSLLEKKGYLIRSRDKEDKRVVNIYSTSLGRIANTRHAQFHKEIVEDVISALTEEEVTVFIRALGSVSTFFRAKYKNTKAI